MKHYLMTELSILIFILVYIQVRGVRNYYIIIYIINKHNLTWTSIITFLIKPINQLLQTIYIAKGRHLSWLNWLWENWLQAQYLNK